MKKSFRRAKDRCAAVVNLGIWNNGKIHYLYLSSRIKTTSFLQSSTMWDDEI